MTKMWNYSYNYVIVWIGLLILLRFWAPNHRYGVVRVRARCDDQDLPSSFNVLWTWKYKVFVLVDYDIFDGKTVSLTA